MLQNLGDGFMLSFMSGSPAIWCACAIQKEIANMDTTADVELDGEMFLQAMPAPALLNLENRLQELKSVYEDIPVIDPSEKWTYDEDKGYYVSETRTSFGTKKVPKSHILYEATKEHAAQVEMYHEDVPATRRETIQFSGALTLADKRSRLARIDRLYEAVKKARQRANDTNAHTSNVSEQVFKYINRE